MQLFLSSHIFKSMWKNRNCFFKDIWPRSFLNTKTDNEKSNHKQNTQSSHKNKTWLTTLTDEGKWDCENTYSSKVFYEQTLSTGKETKGKEGKQEKNIYGDTQLNK